MALPTKGNNNPYKIHDFYERLIAHINTLDTMGKLKEINGYVRFTLDKLFRIRADLMRKDDNWQNWGFNQLLKQYINGLKPYWKIWKLRETIQGTTSKAAYYADPSKHENKRMRL